MYFIEIFCTINVFVDFKVPRASLHPPHLTDSNGLPALIPFCAYGGNMRILGEYIDGLDFPVCNAFKPTILDGELCYALDLKRLELERSGVASKAGRGKGLLLAIDKGISIEPHHHEEEMIEVNRDFIRTELKSTGKRARLNILTSHRHEDSRPGIYTLQVLKKMTGTDNFLAMPDDLKKCQIEQKEECRSRRYVEEVKSRCGCLPWSLTTLVPDQVGSINSDKFQKYDCECVLSFFKF